MAVGRVGSDQHFGAGDEVLKEDSEPSEDQVPVPHYARRRVRSFPTFSPFPAATNPWRYARSDQWITNQTPVKVMKLSGIMDAKGSCPSSANLYASEPLGPCGRVTD